MSGMKCQLGIFSVILRIFIYNKTAYIFFDNYRKKSDIIALQNSVKAILPIATQTVIVKSPKQALSAIKSE